MDIQGGTSGQDVLNHFQRTYRRSTIIFIALIGLAVVDIVRGSGAGVYICMLLFAIAVDGISLRRDMELLRCVIPRPAMDHGNSIALDGRERDKNTDQNVRSH